jgi:predicted GTPase
MEDLADFTRRLGEEFDRAVTELGRVNLILFGKTGVGKSTLINAVCRREFAATGIGKPVTDKVEYYEHPDGLLGLWDTVGFEQGDDGDQILADIRTIVAERQHLEVKDRLHAVWYCVRANDRRFEVHQAELVKALAALGLPVILVLTQVPKDAAGDIDPDATELAAYIDRQRLPLAPDGRSLPVSAKAGFGGMVEHGLQELVEATFRVVPDVARGAFAAAQQVDLTSKREQARKAQKLALGAVAGVVVVPIPLADAAAIVPIQVALIGRISAIYGLPIVRSRVAQLAASAFLSQGIGYLAKSAARSMLRYVPGVNAAATVVNLTVATTFTYAVGEAWIGLCELLHDQDSDAVEAFMNSDQVSAVFMQNFKRASKRAPKALGGSSDRT